MEATAFWEDFDYLFPTARAVKQDYNVGMAAKRIRRALKAPETMVKITGYTHSRAGLFDHGKYVSRNEQQTLYDELGSEVDRALNDILDEIVAQDTPSRANKRYTMDLMLSMPAGTPQSEFRDSVTTFLGAAFTNHRYLYTFHDDTDNYHAHVIVAVRGYDGRRLHPGIDEIQRWRETFANELEHNGIMADATPPFSRGRGPVNTPRFLSELTRRGQRKRPERSPTYDADKEQEAIAKRFSAWGRIAEHFRESRHRDLRELAHGIWEWADSRFLVATRDREHERDYERGR